MKFFQIILLITITFGILSCFNEQPNASEKLPPSAKIDTIIVVKKSSSGICHDKSSGSFVRTKNFTSYETMDLCISSGGRVYKGFESGIDKAEQEAIDENRSFVSLYNRSDWPHWSDTDGDCQNTRHELLIRQSLTAVTFKTEDECIVMSGTWHCKYSGNTFNDSKELDLDHVVPLKFAQGHGGDIWSRDKKREFANDIDNLLLVNASLNRQKGAKGLDEWLPPNHPYRCEYIAHFNAVMTKYGLTFIPSEQRIVNKMVNACNWK
jgi:5-methylcytosine-specific restriction endonuclease McrA